MNILFFLTPKSDVAYIFEDETLRQTVEKMEHRKLLYLVMFGSQTGQYLGLEIIELQILSQSKKVYLVQKKQPQVIAITCRYTWVYVVVWMI